MALTDNPMSLVITGDITVSATLEADALASGNLNLKIGEYYSTMEDNSDIENVSLYGYHANYGMGGSITNNTTELSFRALFVQDVWYDFGVGGNDYTEAYISIYGNYSGHKVTIYDTTTNAILFPETTLSYYTGSDYSYAVSETAKLIDLLMDNIGETIALKVVVK